MKFEELERDANILVCYTLDHPCLTESTIKKCDFCNTPVWKSKSSENLPSSYLMCVDCAKKNVPSDATIAEPSDEQIKNIAETLNIPYEKVKKETLKTINEINKSNKFKNN
jgi:hypothetical protein